MIFEKESFSTIKNKLLTLNTHRNLAILLGFLTLVIVAGVIYLSYSQVESYTDSIQPGIKKTSKVVTPQVTITAQPARNNTTITPTVFMISPTAVPTSIPTPVVTNTPEPTTIPTVTSAPNDTNPPTIHSMTGPENGSTVDFNSFCFPIHVSDDRSSGSQLSSQYRFDSDSWTDWGSNMSPCFSNVSNGEHTFIIHVKDSAGNVSAERSSTFKVEVN